MKTRLNKIISIFLVAVMLLTAAPLSGFVGLDLNLDWLDFTPKASAATYSGTCGGNITWTLDTEKEELVISGTGEMTDYSSYVPDYRPAPWLSYSSSIRILTICNGVTSIGSFAFYCCKSIASVNIPDSVTHIDDYAFFGCSGIKSVTFGKSLTTIGTYAFGSCLSLTGLIMGEKITSIGDSAFYNCSGLTSLTIGESVKTIGNFAFDHCRQLTSVKIGDSVTSIGLTAFINCSENLVFELNKGSYAETYAVENNITYYYRHDEVDEKIISVTVTPELNFVINKETYTMTINCSGDMDSFESGKAPWVSYEPYIKHIIISEGCTSIGVNAFYDFKGLKDIVLSDSVTTIDKYAFYGCSVLINITIPEGVTTIGSEAFYECSSFTNIIIPNSVISIGSSAFRYCTGLASIIIGNSVKSIGSNAFRDCTGITNVTIPDSVTNMGEAVFKNCSGLKNITLSDNIDSINKSMFYECTGLTDIVIPDGVTSIGNVAFYGCLSLASIVIPDSITSIGEEAFYNCAALTNITIPDNVISIGSYAFFGCTGITSVTIPSKLTTIGYHVFNGCSSITSLIIPDSITSIGDYAFRNCTSLTKVTIPISLTTIGNYTFYGCPNLTSVYLPISVLSIGSNAFANCKKLEKLKVYNKNCNLESGCISNNTIICGYAGSTAETYAKEKGYEFELITEGDHEHIYSNSCDSECNICGYVNLNAGHTYKTVVHNPTCQNEGFTVCICTVCKYAYVSEITDTVDHDMRWVVVTKPTSSADGVKNYSCSYCGLVEDTKVVPAFLISDKSVANIDFDSNTISGFDAGATSIDDYVSVETDGYSFTCDSAVIGTGTVIELTDGDTVITEFTAVVFGDVNGDGWYDGTDSIIVSCLANGLLSKDDVSPAFYTAADCNHDGVIDSFDVAILEQAGLLLSGVDQSKSNEELATDEAFIEYLDLIDQTPEDEEIVEDEVIETPEVEPETEEFDLIEFIITIIKKFFELLLSTLPIK